MDKVERLPPPVFNKGIFASSLAKLPSLPPCGMRLNPRERKSFIRIHKNDSDFTRNEVSVETVETVTESKPSEIYFCEACELEFHCVEDLKLHRLQHEKCPIGDCKFLGHASIMDKHITDLHTSGLFDKCKKLSTPEEIAAWREERRKRYPTLANVLQKQKALEQKQKRGERLEPDKSRFGKVGNQNKSTRKQIQSQSQKRTRKRNHKTRRKSNRRLEDAKEISTEDKSLKSPLITSKRLKENEQKDSDVEDDAGINMFAGTSRMKDYKHKHREEERKPANALNFLLGAYASDGSNDSEEETCSDTNSNGINNGHLSTDSLQTENVDEKNFIIEKEDITRRENEDITRSENKDIAIGEDADMVGINHSSDDEGPEECPIIHDEGKFTQQATPKVAKVVPTEATEKSQHQLSKESNVKLKSQTCKRKLGLAHAKPPRRSNTMLAKLLDADIRHERNVLLQCVRYICENNYFRV